MNNWKLRAIAKANEIDFVKNETKIKGVFKKSCSSLIDIEGITFDDENSTLNIKDKYYKLEIEKEFIRIVFLTDAGQESEVFYGVDSSKKEFAYGQGTNINPYRLQFEKIYGAEFNYEEIIDNLMDLAIN